MDWYQKAENELILILITTTRIELTQLRKITLVMNSKALATLIYLELDSMKVMMKFFQPKSL